MFERYTEKARRVIFFAVYEAKQFGSPYVESEHLLLGWIREDKTLTCGLITPDDGENIRSAIESSYKGEKKVPTAGDLPLSSECKQVLNNAAKQADQLSAPHIGTEHLLLGLLSQKSMTAELLTQRGITSEHILQALKKPPSAERPKPRRSSMPPSPGSWPDAT